jgi:glycogenin glucosyltransferase
MRREDGSRRFAFVGFLMLNDNYLPGALTLAYGLRRQEADADLVCLTTDGVSTSAHHALEQLYDRVLPVERFYVPHVRRQERQDRPYFFTRLNSLRLGADGDLGCRYDRVVVIDADVLPLRCYDHLFALQSPAGIMNERKEHFVETDEGGGYSVPDEVLASGRWVWHRVYDGVCPHGQPIPAELTDRVWSQPPNMGINGSLFVFEPSMAELDAIREDVERPEVRQLVGDLFDWPDMQYLTMRWSGRWHSIDGRFSGLNGYPSLDLLCGTHFAGFKPWYFNREKAMARYRRHADFQRWFAVYEQMVTEGYPQLREVRKLCRILEQVQAVRATGGATGSKGGRRRKGQKRRR